MTDTTEMLRAFRYRLYPTDEQTEILDTQVRLCRTLYNAALEERINWYKEAGVSLRYKQQCAELPELKKTLPEFKAVYAQVLQSTLRRLDGAFDNFFRRVKQRKAGKNGKAGFPRFKGRNRFNSILYPQYRHTFSVTPNGALHLPSVGDVRMAYHRPVEGQIKTLSVKRDAVGSWWAVIACELPDVPNKKPKTLLGVDVGLENIVTLSTGEAISPPKCLRKSEQNIKVLQRKLSRTEKRSRRREKARIRLARAHRRIEDQRNDFLHKLANGLVARADVVAFEGLNIQNMMKNHCLSKSIGDASWGKLMSFTAYKAENAGKFVKFVNPAGTSILCARCGAEVPKRLNERLHLCQACGFELSRDWNAALNIKARLGPDWTELAGKKLVEGAPTPPPHGGGERV